MIFARAERVADAVLYEGYILYPYRASALKNQTRWQFGVVVPRGYAEGGGGEPWAMQTECLVDPQGAPAVEVRVRFLQLQARRVERAAEDGAGGFEPTDGLPVDGDTLVPWDEGVERTLDLPATPLADLLPGERTWPLEVPGGQDVEPVRDGAGRVRGRLVRERWPITGQVRLAAERIESLVRLRVRIENGSAGAGDGTATRPEALRHALLGAHTLLAVREGRFVSLLEPPRWAERAAAGCQQAGTWPVLVGEPGQQDVLLSSPIILYDYPEVAAESPGDLFDATEIDEILTLRVMTLTEEEKREARATDPRARRIVERSDAMPPEVLDRLHGVIRYLKPPADPVDARERAKWDFSLDPQAEVPPDQAVVRVGPRRVAKGSRVRLHPRRRADSLDPFLAGRVARVEGVYRDVDEETYVAVLLEDDPAAELHRWHGRYLFFYPEEIEPLDAEAPGGPDPSPDQPSDLERRR